MAFFWGQQQEEKEKRLGMIIVGSAVTGGASIILGDEKVKQCFRT